MVKSHYTQNASTGMSLDNNIVITLLYFSGGHYNNNGVPSKYKTYQNNNIYMYNQSYILICI